MERIRVAMTLEQLWHRVPGGTGVAGLGMAAGLAARDDVEVIGVAAKHRDAPPDAWAPPVPVRQLPLPRLALYEAWHRLRWPAVESATGPIDVIHATSIATPPRKRSPLLVTIHDLAFLHDESHFTSRGLRFFHRGMELSQKEADLVICPSRATLDDCAANGFDLSQLRLVPMGVAQKKATEEDVAAARRRYDLPARFVLWTGTIEPRKNLPRLLRAFGRLDTQDVELVLVGPRGWNEELGPLVAASPRRIRTLGFVPPADLPAIYAAAEVFCFPSLFEGFGLPVLEAMAQGTPVVTSSGTSTAEVGGDAAWLVPPRDTVTIAHALDEILNDPARSARMGEDGIARAATYTWDETARNLVEVYREVV